MKRLVIVGLRVSLKGTIIFGWIFLLLVPILSVTTAPQRSKYRRQAPAKTLEVSNTAKVDSDDGGIWYPTIDVEYDEVIKPEDNHKGQTTANHNDETKQAHDHQKQEMPQNLDYSVHEQHQQNYDTKKESDTNDSNSSKENSEEIESAETENETDEYGHWVKTISSLFKKFGFQDDQIPEPFGTKKTNNIEEPSPEFGLILKSLTSNVPPSLKQQLDEIIHSNGITDIKVNSQDGTTLLTKMGNTINGLGGEARYSPHGFHNNENKQLNLHKDAEADNTIKEEHNSLEGETSHSSHGIQLHNDDRQLKLNIDAESDKIKKEIQEIAQLELIRHKKHQTGHRGAKETAKITQLINDMHDLGLKEKLHKQQMLEFEPSRTENQGEQKIMSSQNDYSDVSPEEVGKDVETSSHNDHLGKETNENNAIQDVQEVVDEEIEEENKLNEEHDRHKEEMMKVIKQLKISDTSEGDEERIEKIEDVIEQIDKQHYKELDLQKKFDTLVQTQEVNDPRSSAQSTNHEEENSMELDQIKDNHRKIHKYTKPGNHPQVTGNGHSKNAGRHYKQKSNEHNSDNIELTEKFHHVKKTRKGSKHHEDAAEKEEPNSMNQNQNYVNENNDFDSESKSNMHVTKESNNINLNENYINENNEFDSESSMQITEDTIHESMQGQTVEPILATVNFLHFIEVGKNTDSIDSNITQYTSGLSQSQTQGSSNEHQSAKSAASNSGVIMYKNDVLHQNNHDLMSNSISNHDSMSNSISNQDSMSNSISNQDTMSDSISNHHIHDSANADSNDELEEIKSALRNLKGIVQNMEATAHMENDVAKVIDEGPQFSEAGQLHSTDYDNTDHDLTPEYLENVIQQEREPEEGGQTHHHLGHHIQEHGDAIKRKRNARNTKRATKTNARRK